MGLLVGDFVFDRSGRPGLVVGKDKQNETLLVQREGEEFEAARRRGVINGLPLEARQKFHQVIDEVKQIEDPEQKIAHLTQKLDELKQDPRNYLISRYVQSEMAHIMNTEKLQPREFNVDLDSVRA